MCCFFLLLAANDYQTVVFFFLVFFQVLLRMKENEIEYLHKEISCLRNELQFLNTVLFVVCCYKYVYFSSVSPTLLDHLGGMLILISLNEVFVNCLIARKPSETAKLPRFLGLCCKQ